MACVCIVPQCKNNTIDTQNKLFIKVPSDKKIREQWLNRAGAPPMLMSNPNIYFCEDHFNEKKLEKLKQCISSNSNVEEILPSRFQCQKENEASTSLADTDSVMRQSSHLATDESEAHKEDGESGDADSKTADFDKFKRRLIRAVARHMFVDKTPEQEMWSKLKKETGCDCQLLWKHMRSLTRKKLRRMLSVDDRIDSVTKVARLTLTDWLLFDLVMVHEKVDVIGQDMWTENGEEPKALNELFALVNKYEIESFVGVPLVSAWMNLVLEYNGKARQCSPMLLQRRWHQMKEATRLKFYNFWYVYRGNTRQLDKACQDGGRPTELQLDIAKRYKAVVTQPFAEWEELIQSKKVILPEEFDKMRNPSPRKSRDENVPDIEVVEPHVETIDLDENSDSENNDANIEDSNVEDAHIESEFRSSDDDIAELIRNPPTCDSNDGDVYLEKNQLVEKTSVEDGLSDVKLLKSEQIPLEDDEPILIKNEPDTSFEVDIVDENLPIDNTADSMEISKLEQQEEMLMPKIMSVTGAAETPSYKDNLESVLKRTADEFVEQTKQNIHKLNKNIDITHSKNVSHEIQGNSNESTTLHPTSSSININLAVEAIKNDIESKENTFDDEVNELNLIDDEIEFEDDGIEFIDEDNYSKDFKTELKTEAAGKDEVNEEDDTPKFDIKLLLTPTVYTKKLEHMDVFKFIEYDCVRDTRVIEFAAAESKPIDKKAFKKEHVEPVDDPITDPAECDEVYEDYASNSYLDDENKKSVKCSNWMLQKPKKRTYNPIQLCKNPDFNTRLKRLTAGFFISERNRKMLKECKPLTIDVHKSFESKLVNGTLIVKDARFKVLPAAKNAIDTSPVMTEIITSPNLNNVPIFNKNLVSEPLAQHIFALKQEIFDKIPQGTLPAERKKIISLPDIHEIRRVNQRLLTAEVTPIQCNTNYKPPVELVANIERSYLNAHPAEALENSKSKITPYENKRISNSIGLIENESGKSQSIDKTSAIQTKSKDVKITKSLSKRQITKKLSEVSTMPKIKSVYIPMGTNSGVSWLSRKIHYKECPMDDCLLASDTLDKMITVLTGESDGAQTKQEKKKISKQRIKEREMNEKHLNTTSGTNAIQVENVETEIQANNPETIIQADNNVKQLLTDKNQNAKANSETKEKVIVHKTKVDKKGVKQVCITKKKNKKKGSTVIDEKGNENFVALSGKRYCCWAKARLAKDSQVNSHKCPTPLCYCCCRDLLIKNTLSKEMHKNKPSNDTKQSSALLSEPIVLSDDDDSEESQKNTHNNQLVLYPSDTDVNCSQILPKIDQVISIAGLNANDNLSALLQAPTSLNDSNIASLSPITKNIDMIKINEVLAIPDSNLNSNTENVSISDTPSIKVLESSKVMTTPAPPKVKTYIKSAVSPYSVVDNRRELSVKLNDNVENNSVLTIDKAPEPSLVMSPKKLPNRSLHKKPIFLGQNNILLSSVKPRLSDDIQLTTDNVEDISQNLVPLGVRVVLLPNGDLALTIDPGVNLDTNQLATLPTILTAIQQQINMSGLNSLAMTLNSAVSPDQGNVLSHNKSINDQPSLQEIQNPADINDTLIQTAANSNTILESQNVINSEELPESLGQNITEANINNDNKQIEGIESNLPSKQSQVVDTPSVTSESNIQQDDDIIDVSVTKKSILSDLMEMSGISAEDTKNVHNDNLINFSPNFHTQTNTVTPESNIHSAYTPIVISVLARRPDLYIITSYAELKYSIDNDGRFYKIDTITGAIAAINVTIKKRGRPQGRTLGPKSIIDLTDDLEQENYFPPLADVATKSSRQTGSSNRGHLATKCVSILRKEKTKPVPVKPIKMFRAVHRSILKPRQTTQEEETNNENVVAAENVEGKSDTGISRRKRKQSIQPNETIELDLEDETNVNDTLNSLFSVTLPNNAGSDSDSDDEPLAKKVLRKQNPSSTVVPQSEVISDLPVEEKAPEIIEDPPVLFEANEEGMLEDSPVGIQPVMFEPNDDEMSGEDCILGF